LVAYYTAADSLDPAALRESLKASLPPYMVPTYWARLDAIPHNASGKVDRKALPAPSESVSENSGYTAPETDAEKAIAETWQSVLGVERVGLDDDYFDLGGDSIKSI